MKYVLLTKEEAIKDAFLSPESFLPSDTLTVFEDWKEALDASSDADMIFVDLIATLNDPGKIAGYEEFAMAKMAHETAKDVPLVLIAAPADYDIDFMVGWPDFVFAQLQRPVTTKIFRRASTWI